jgi:prepilin-type N-terminal cleavage/methylation domain-containing protein
MESFSLLTTRPRGFTLVEMIVVLALISIITAIVLNGNGNFDKTITLTDTAFTVALSVREAQSFGLSSRTYNGATNAAYGVHIGPAPASSYVLFADVYPNPNSLLVGSPADALCPGHTAPAGSPDAKIGNCVYDSTQGETVQTFKFGRGMHISQICGHAGGLSTCALTGIDIVFLRPNTDSIVTGLTAGGPVALTDAQITLSDPTNTASKKICITSVGEISVSNGVCP